jgi:UDP-2,3-diacylglucosamine pyrophosphatase LpxH
MSRFADKLRELRERATKGPWSESESNQEGLVAVASDGFDVWVVSGRKKDRELIAFLANHAAEIEALVRAADEVCNPSGYRDYLVSHNELRQALSALDKE